MFDLTPYGRRNHIVNPFRDLDTFEKKFFSDFDIAEFKTDITEKEDSYLLEADLPGFKKEDIHVDVQENSLVIRAERSSDEEKKDSSNVVHRERSYGSFSRSFDISNVNTEAITAKYTNGVLELTLPKKTAIVSNMRRLEIQ